MARGNAGRRLIRRFGCQVEPDEVFDATASRSVARMLRALDLSTNAVDRHYLLQALVDALYSRRKAGGTTRSLLLEVGQLHIDELPRLLPELSRHRVLEAAQRVAPPGAVEAAPAVSAFDRICAAYCEAGEFDLAHDVWREARAIGYVDDAGLETAAASVEKRRRRMTRSKPA